MKPAVILVGADKGGVGKTTVSRALLDYLAANNILTRAFDTETPRGVLKRFYPRVSEVVDITQASDQMKILDTLNSSQVKVSVIDTRAGALGLVLRALRDVGFLDAVQNGEFTFLAMHILGPSIASLEEIAEMAPYVSNANYFMVKNHTNEANFFEWDPVTHAKYFDPVKTSGEINIPKLNPMAYEKVELSGTSFANFVANQTAQGDSASNSFVLRGYVRTWLHNVFDELNRIALLDAIAGKGSR